MGRLIAVSNRTAAGEATGSSGGLAVALLDALSETPGSWFGTSGEIVNDAKGLRIFSENNVDYELTDLTQEEHEGYYLGYANSALWPIFHSRTDLAAFDNHEFKIYSSVNERFAKQIAARVRRDDTIWVHDYHFLLLGKDLRDEGVESPIGFFLHIPFPAPEIFKTLPEHARLARAMTSFDLIGFQTEKDRTNFERYLVDECGGIADEDGSIRVFESKIQTGAYPIGIDAKEFANLTQGDAAREAAARLGRFLGERNLIIGADRMDYSKGLPQRFEAIGSVFDNYPDLRGKVSFTQIAPPSRGEVHEYAELRRELDQLAGRINGDYGELDWIPIRYLARGYRRDELAGLYRLGRVGLVTPLRDGMNLVAKEFVAAQNPDNPGVLVLSEFAGAAERMEAALIVNPHDTSAMAEAVVTALQMPLEERRERWTDLHHAVFDFDAAWWQKSFLKDLQTASMNRYKAVVTLAEARRTNRP